MAAKEFLYQRCIGTGCFGQVWLAEGNNKNCALKELKVKGMTSKEIDQAITEVKVLSQLGHVNIIRYKQAFLNKEETLCIAMEYTDGGDLSARIQKQSATGLFFEENKVLNWFIQISFALKYIHKLNILHRDLKPQNIFLTKTNVVKVGDFDITKVLLADSGIAETAIGTPYCMSPEVCQSKPYNKKSDIWALGCLLYELATLKRAFTSLTFNNLIVKVTHGEYGRLPSHYSFHPTSALIELMLQQEPDDRPTADQLLKLPSLKPHITRYEQMFSSLTKEKRAKRAASAVAKETSENVPAKASSTVESSLLLKSRPPLRRELSRSVPESLSQLDQQPLVKNKQRALSARARKQPKGDLRKAVILKQMRARKSSNLSSSSHIASPSVSPILTPASRNLDISTMTNNDVVKCDSGKQMPCVDACCKAMLAAMGGGHTDSSTEQLYEMLHQRIGKIDTGTLMTKLENYLEENANVSQSHFSLDVIKPFLPGSVTSEELLLALNILNMERKQM